MPAIKNPVINRNENNDTASVANQATDELNNAPDNEHTKNNFTGEKRSAKEKKAKTKVPATKPSITAEVTRLIA